MSVRQRAASALGYVCLGLAASALLLACEPGDAPACAQEELQRGALCEPADARLRPQVRAAAQGELDWGSSAVEPLMIGHSAELRLDLDLDADKLRSRVTVLALAPATAEQCVLASLAVDHPGGRKLHALRELARVPPECAALVGRSDLYLATVFDPQRVGHWPARDDHAPGHAALAGTPADPAQRAQFGACGGGKVSHTAPSGAPGCRPVVLQASTGPDLRAQAMQLHSSVGVVEFAGPALVPVAARPAGIRIGPNGEEIPTAEVGALDPADHAPTLADGPVVSAQLALAADALPSAGLPAQVAVDLAIRPAGVGPWEPVLHHGQGGDGQPTPDRPVDTAELAEGVGLNVQVALPAALRDRATRGDWQQHKLFELRACVRAALNEAGPAADPLANNCRTGQFLLVRLQKDYGAHGYVAAAAPAAAAASADYFEMGKQGHVPFAAGMIAIKHFRGAYREVEDGHVRLGAKIWAKLVFFLTIETDKLVEAGAYHDTAPAASDFVSGYLTVKPLFTYDLPKYDVAENFKFELNASVDTKSTDADFGGSANLGPLVDALNFVAKQGSSDGLKWCFFDVACIEPPLQLPATLTLGLALAKNTTVPKCELVKDFACFAYEDKQRNFWDNAKACSAVTGAMASDHDSPGGRAAMRALANKWNSAFWLGSRRPGNDYFHGMGKSFFDQGWGSYGTVHKSTIPTHWAIYDWSLTPENGECAVVAPDSAAKLFQPSGSPPTVAQLLPKQPGLIDEAVRSHLGCEAKLPTVCEYPVQGDKVMLENSQVYLQQTGKIVIDGHAEYTKQLIDNGGVSLNALKGTLAMDGFLIKTTWAATAGIRWNVGLNDKQKWHVKGTNYATVKLTGQIGEFAISGEGCVFLGLPEVCVDIGLTEICTPEIGHWECLKIDLGGLTKLLATPEVGMNFALEFLPFDVNPQ